MRVLSQAEFAKLIDQVLDILAESNETVPIEEVKTTIREALKKFGDTVVEGTLCNWDFMAGAACELPIGHEGAHWTGHP